jgi:hypothetical protein
MNDSHALRDKRFSGRNSECDRVGHPDEEAGTVLTEDAVCAEENAVQGCGA